jgi:pimeloyl-ACP methyl ester carboxylesterase
MPQAQSNGIRLEYEVLGSRDREPLLMIHGVGAQLIQWPQGLCDSLVSAGFRVIRYDSRDTGLSTHFDGAPIPDPAAVFAARRRGEEPSLPYTISDMAADAAGLLDALEIERAHVLGVSLGGQVAQALAIEHPGRVLSLALMMTYSGNPEVAPASPTALAGVTSTGLPQNEETILQNAVDMARSIGSPAYPAAETVIRERALAVARRAHHPAGAARHLAAGRGAPDRRKGLQALAIPTLVIHGDCDPLVPPACGRDIARNVKGALMLGIDGMGHDMPPELFYTFVSAVAANARRVIPDPWPRAAVTPVSQPPR